MEQTKKYRKISKGSFAQGNPLSLSEKVEELSDRVDGIDGIDGVETNLVGLSDPESEMVDGSPYSTQSDANKSFKTRIDNMVGKDGEFGDGTPTKNQRTKAEDIVSDKDIELEGKISDNTTAIQTAGKFGDGTLTINQGTKAEYVVSEKDKELDVKIGDNRDSIDNSKIEIQNNSDKSKLNATKINNNTTAISLLANESFDTKGLYHGVENAPLDVGLEVRPELSETNTVLDPELIEFIGNGFIAKKEGHLEMAISGTLDNSKGVKSINIRTFLNDTQISAYTYNIKRGEAVPITFLTLVNVVPDDEVHVTFEISSGSGRVTSIGFMNYILTFKGLISGGAGISNSGDVFDDSDVNENGINLSLNLGKEANTISKDNQLKKVDKNIITETDIDIISVNGRTYIKTYNDFISFGGFDNPHLRISDKDVIYTGSKESPDHLATQGDLDGLSGGGGGTGSTVLIVNDTEVRYTGLKDKPDNLVTQSDLDNLPGGGGTIHSGSIKDTSNEDDFGINLSLNLGKEANTISKDNQLNKQDKSDTLAIQPESTTYTGSKDSPDDLATQGDLDKNNAYIFDMVWPVGKAVVIQETSPVYGTWIDLGENVNKALGPGNHIWKRTA